MNFKIGDRVWIKPDNKCEGAVGRSVMCDKRFNQAATINSFDSYGDFTISESVHGGYYGLQWIDKTKTKEMRKMAKSKFKMAKFKLSDGTELEGLDLGGYIHLQNPIEVQGQEFNSRPNDQEQVVLVAYRPDGKSYPYIVKRHKRTVCRNFSKCIDLTAEVEMTVKQISEKLGIDNLKIVKEI